MPEDPKPVETPIEQLLETVHARNPELAKNLAIYHGRINASGSKDTDAPGAVHEPI